MNEIKGDVDGISTFPAETEQPIISSLQFVGQTILLALSGDTDERTLKITADRIRDDISQLDGISQVAVNVLAPVLRSRSRYQGNTLRQYDLTLSNVASAVRSASLDMPGGSIKTEGGKNCFAATGQAYRAPSSKISSS
ncbi:MAG: hypothetical protein U5O39_14220 [Gammaproteobacteria bacterium]|nr:hypothetical protein [Gammaproteobacteria bacterium]